MDTNFVDLYVRIGGGGTYMRSEDSEKYHLRPLHSYDALSVYQLMSDKRVTRYMEGFSPLKEIEDANRFMEMLIEADSDTSSSLVLGIADKNNLLIGLVGFDEMDVEEANLFFALRPEYWNKGIMSEMIMSYLSMYGAKVSRIVAIIHIDNIAALRMIRKFDTVIVS